VSSSISIYRVYSVSICNNLVLYMKLTLMLRTRFTTGYLFACYSTEMALEVDLDIAFGVMSDCKGVEGG
jgi:hypothetical protein